MKTEKSYVTKTWNHENQTSKWKIIVRVYLDMQLPHSNTLIWGSLIASWNGLTLSACDLPPWINFDINGHWYLIVIYLYW